MLPSIPTFVGPDLLQSVGRDHEQPPEGKERPSVGTGGIGFEDPPGVVFQKGLLFIRLKQFEEGAQSGSTGPFDDWIVSFEDMQIDRFPDVEILRVGCEDIMIGFRFGHRLGMQSGWETLRPGPCFYAFPHRGMRW